MKKPTEAPFFTTNYWRASYDPKTRRAVIDLPAKLSLFRWLLPTPSSLHRIKGYATRSDSSIVSFYYSSKRSCTIKNTAGKTKKTPMRKEISHLVYSRNKTGGHFDN